MKVAMVTRPNTAQWGGDLKAMYAIKEGMEGLGHTVNTVSVPTEIGLEGISSGYDHIIL